MMQSCSSVHILIPARLQSTRLPNKLLLRYGEGVEILLRVWRTAIKVREELRKIRWDVNLKVLCPAEERDQIGAVIRKNDYGMLDPIYSSPQPFANGTLRVADYLVAASSVVSWDHLGSGAVIHIQADEPELEAEDILQTFWDFLKLPIADVQTLVSRPEITKGEGLDKNIVKACVQARSAFVWGFERDIAKLDRLKWNRHAGLYVYRPHYPLWYRDLAVAPDENDLEQNRGQYHGARFRATFSDRLIRGINTREDYNEFLERTGGNRGSASETSRDLQQDSSPSPKDGDSGKPE